MGAHCSENLTEFMEKHLRTMVKIKTALLCDSDVRTTTLHTYYENLVFLTI